MSREPVIEVTGVTRRFGETIAIRDLDLRVFPGEVYGFLGPNGAGKTTTIRLLLGLLASTSGEIRVFGSPVRIGAAGPRDTGAMVERPGLYPHLTAAENLRVFSRAAGLRLPDGEVRAALDAAGVDPRNRTTVQRFSSGMRQRVALAVALLGRPRLVVLDEPTDGLDPVGIVDVRRTIASLVDRGATVFLSSHLLTEVERVCSRIGILMAGRLVREGTVDDLSRAATQLVIEFANGQAMEDARRRLGELGFPSVAGASPTEIVLPASDVEQASVMRALVGVGIAPARVSVRQAGLEELFMRLVGESRTV